LKTNSLQERENDRELPLDSIQDELEDEPPLQFKRPMTKAKSKILEDQIYYRLLMLQTYGN